MTTLAPASDRTRRGRAWALVVAMAAVTLATACAGGDERQPPAADTAPGGAAGAPGAATDGTVAAAPADTTCVVAPLTDSSAGPLRLGMTVEEARARCPAARDTTVLADEGMRERTLVVPLGREARDTVVASIVNDRVWRLAATTGGPRTAAGLGVGSPLARVLALPGARGITGEGRTFVVADAPCGLSFQLSNGVGGAEADSAALARLPAGTIVRRVLVTGCG